MTFARLYFVFVLFFLGLSQIVLAQETIFGPEWEFTRPDLQIGNPKGLRGGEQSAAKSLAEAIKNKCLHFDCKVQQKKGKWSKWFDNHPEFLVRFNDGFWINISIDPMCVEVQAKPLTVDMWKKKKDLIQNLLFDSAKELGLTPSKTGAGHINVSVLKAFGSIHNVRDFTNFVIDYFNHPELASSILRDYSMTSIPITDQITKKTSLIDLQEKFIRLITMVESNQIKTIQEVAEFILDNIYKSHPNSKQYRIERNQSLNLLNILDMITSPNYTLDQPLEIRAVRAQKDMGEFIKIIELLQGRIYYLKKYYSDTYVKPNIIKTNQLSKSQIKTRFQNYVEQSNLSFVDYQYLLSTLSGTALVCRSLLM